MKRANKVLLLVSLFLTLIFLVQSWRSLLISAPSSKQRHQTLVAGGEMPRWQGTKCFPGTILSSPKLKDKCQSKKEILVADHFCKKIEREQNVCGQYSEGVFGSPLVTNNLALLLQKRSCTAQHLNRILDPQLLEFVGDAPNETLRTKHCSDFAYLSPIEAVAVLQHAAGPRKGLVFTGDSMMRQLMLRLISYLRQENVISEHYFHQDGLYVLRSSGDQLSILDKNGKKQNELVLRQCFPQYLGNTANDEQLPQNDLIVAFLFLWDARPSEFRKEVLSLRNAVHVAAFMYWWQNKASILEIEPYIAAMEKSFERTMEQRKFIFVTTPWTAPGTFGGVEDRNRIPRNQRIARWILGANESADVEKAAGVSKYILDFAGIASTSQFAKTKDNIHYMCIWTPKAPELANAQKYNLRGCSERMNLAVVQWLLHLLLLPNDYVKRIEITVTPCLCIFPPLFLRL